MGHANSKVDCIWLPGQSGKTRNVMERIKTLEAWAAAESEEGYLNIIISANNRSLVDQTEVRMNKELFADEEDEEADSKIEGSCFKWRSGLKNNNVSVGDLTFRILEGDVTMVVCCAHSKRLTYLYQLIANLERSKLFKKGINIWIDEADASINLWSKTVLDVTPLSKVKKVTLVSATYDSILKRYGKIRVLPCLETMLPIYHRVQDSIIVKKDIAADGAPSYLANIITRYEKFLCKPGVRLFAPGDVERVSHEAIADYLKLKGFAVVIINGVRKEVILPDGSDPIPLAPYLKADEGDPEEIGRIIANIYNDSELYRYPFAITGHLCLGRGITFQNKDFLFTHGILFTIADKANAYQTACRLAGNIKGFADYKKPLIFTTSKMFSVISEKEETAINIARHVSENELTHVDMEMIDCLYGSKKAVVREEDFEAEWFEYATFEEAKAKAPRLREKECIGGFYQSSFAGPATTLPYEEVLRAKAGKKTANMPTDMDEGEHRSRLYIGYKDISDPSSAVFVVRQLKRINQSRF